MQSVYKNIRTLIANGYKFEAIHGESTKTHYVELQKQKTEELFPAKAFIYFHYSCLEEVRRTIASAERAYREDNPS